MTEVQQLGEIPVRVDGPPRFGLVGEAELLGQLGGVQRSQVGAAVTDVDVGGSAARVHPIDDSRQTLVTPQQVEVLIVAMDEHPFVRWRRAQCRRALVAQP